MVTIKSYTDIEQSNELVEILPIESADMWFYPYPNDEYWYEVPNIGNADKKYNQLPCWSLAALLNILPNGTDVVKEEADTENERYMCTVGINDDIISTFADNPVDACYEMIIKLHELKNL